MRGRVKVQDTADVFYHFANGDTRFFGCMNTASLEKTVDTEDIRCGIGFGLASILYSNPDMTLTFTPAFWNDFFIEDASGASFTEGEAVNVWTYEKVIFTDTAGDATATITGTPVGDVVKVQDLQGKMYSATFATSTVTVASAGGTLTEGIVSYQKASTGDVLEFNADSYPKVHGITIHTIAYDPDTNEVVSDLYFTFDKVVGDGALSMALTGATNSITEISARVLPDVTGLFGKYIVVDRA